MTDINNSDSPASMPPPRYKQSKRKPIGVMLASLIPLLFSVIYLLIQVFGLVDEVVEGDGTNIYKLYIAIGIFVLVPLIVYIISYAVWRSDGFSLHEDGISYDLTFVIKRYVKLPFDKINTVKIKRSFFNLLLGLSVVQIGSGSGLTSNAPEISLYFEKNYAQYFMEYIQRRSAAAKANAPLDEEFVPPSNEKSKAVTKAQDSESDTVSFGDKMRMIFTNDLFYFGIIISILFPLAVNLIQKLPSVEDTIDTVTALISSGVLLALTIAGSIIGILLRYYDYRIYEHDGCINISYGLLSKQTFSINHDKIRGYAIRQGLIGQLCKTGSLRLSVVGINNAGANGQQSITYLYPCAKLSRLKEIIAAYLPEYEFSGESQKAGKHAFTHNFIIPAAWFTLFYLPVILTFQLLLGLWYMMFIPIGILFIMLIHSLLLKRNTCLGLSDKHLFARTGGFYKTTFILKTDSVQEISSYAGFIRRQANICTYRIVYRGDNPLTGSMFLVRNLPRIGLDKFI